MKTLGFPQVKSLANAMLDSSENAAAKRHFFTLITLMHIFARVVVVAFAS